jgi:SPX domain-containing protein involved in vacuolar polyphosphate accumulation
VQQILTNTYPIEAKKEKMIKDGSTQEEADDWECLVREITQAISSKQLVPTMRTQYMRTAFQIPFDATVRVSLDTNLCMISERGYDLKNMTVWHRDHNQTIAHNEITRFPHAVLEIKLELKDANAAPPKWVTDLQNSGLLYEVHKFSKFIHGCAVMMPEDVRAVPYWVDDASLRPSILASGGGRILVRSDMTDAEKKKLKHPGSGPGANQVYDHLLPFGDIENSKINTALGRTAQCKPATQGVVDSRKKRDSSGQNGYGVNFYSDADLEEFDEEEDEDTCVGWLFPFCSPYNNLSVVAPTSVQKIEPKIFFANERTFLHWLHAGITLYTISSGILVFSGKEGSSWAHWYAMALLPIALGFCIYALHVFLWRADRIKTRVPGRWDDPRGPFILGGALAIILTLNFIAKLVQIWKYESNEL